MTSAITGVILICVIFGMPTAGLMIGLLGWPKLLYIICPLPSAGIAVLSFDAASTNDTAAFFGWIYGCFAALTVILEVTGYLVARNRDARPVTSRRPR
jgi:hypothetical protein